MTETVVISRRRFEQLLAAEAELRRLELNGVDNWDGYSIGLEDEPEDEPED